jgi:replicative DNA helicase
MNKYGFNVFVVELPSDVKDLDQYVVKHGLPAFQELARNPMSAHRWMGKRILEKHDLDADMGEREALDELVAHEGTITDPLDRRQFRESTCAELKLSEDALEGMFQEHRENLREREARDRLTRLGRDLAQAAEGRSLSKIKDEVEKTLSTISMGKVEAASPFDPDAAIVQIQEMPEFLRTGYRSLDRLGVIRSPSIIVVAARVAHGKTAFLLNLFRKALAQKENAGRPFIVAPMENEPPDLLCKLVGAETGLSAQEVQSQIRCGIMSRAVMDALDLYRGYFADKRLYVLSDRKLRVDGLCTQAAQIKADHGHIGALAIDYIGLLANREEGENTEQRYAMIMNRVTALSRELQCPVFLVAQINREADKQRKSPRARMPRADQLRYSGQIESDADAVLGLFNVTHDQKIDSNNTRNPDEETRDESGIGPASDAQLTLLCLKNRFGPVFGPINFRMTNGTRIEEWNAGDVSGDPTTTRGDQGDGEASPPSEIDDNPETLLGDLDF